MTSGHDANVLTTAPQERWYTGLHWTWTDVLQLLTIMTICHCNTESNSSRLSFCCLNWQTLAAEKHFNCVHNLPTLIFAHIYVYSIYNNKGTDSSGATRIQLLLFFFWSGGVQKAGSLEIPGFLRFSTADNTKSLPKLMHNIEHKCICERRSPSKMFYS